MSDAIFGDNCQVTLHIYVTDMTRRSRVQLSLLWEEHQTRERDELTYTMNISPPIIFHHTYFQRRSS